MNSIDFSNYILDEAEVYSHTKMKIQHLDLLDLTRKVK